MQEKNILLVLLAGSEGSAVIIDAAAAFSEREAICFGNITGAFFDAAKKWTVILPCLDSCYSNIKLLFIYYNIFLGIFKSKIYALGFFIRSTDEKSLIGSINANKTMRKRRKVFCIKSSIFRCFLQGHFVKLGTVLVPQKIMYFQCYPAHNTKVCNRTFVLPYVKT